MYRVIVLSALILLPQPNWAAGPATAKPPVKAPVKPALTDVEVERRIRERFAASKINANHFQVKVAGGVATLEGRTEIIQHKGTATRLAKLSGARTVKNNIVVSDKAKAKAQANLAEGRRRAQVKRGEVRSPIR